MKIINSLMAIVAVSAVCQISQAQWGRTQQLTVNLYDREIAGQDYLRLRDEVQRQYPGINLSFAELMSVQLVAKSRMGRASASLLVGGAQSGDYTIPGNPRDWMNPNDWTFTNTYINNDRGSSQGPWQIIVTGNVKVRSVTLTILQRQPRPTPPPRPQPPRPQPPRPGPGPNWPTRVIDVKGQSYHPDELTAQGICIANGMSRSVGSNSWRQAGATIEGKRSFDGSANFQVHKWYTGIALENVTCQ